MSKGILNAHGHLAAGIAALALAGAIMACAMSGGLSVKAGNLHVTLTMSAEHGLLIDFVQAIGAEPVAIVSRR